MHLQIRARARIRFNKFLIVCVASGTLLDGELDVNTYVYENVNISNVYVFDKGKIFLY
jgi:hypothetical protein